MTSNAWGYMSSVAYLTRVNVPCSFCSGKRYIQEQENIVILGIKLIHRVAENGSFHEALLRRKPAYAGELESVFPRSSTKRI
jgi:hypothetical protein